MRALVLVTCLGACSWSAFDDLADSTWAHSQDKPNVGSSDYGLAIVGASTGTSGARLAVIGNSSPTYSTLAYDAHGGTAVGPNPQKLSGHFISALPEQPIFVGDGAGHVALVAAAIDPGNIAVVSGDADTVGDAPFSSPAPPDAAAFLDTTGTLAIAADKTLFVLTTGTPKQCALPAAVAALAHDATTLWAWTKTGDLVGYDLAAAKTCTVTQVSAPRATMFMPGPGARIHVINGYAVLAAHVVAGTMSAVIVAPLTGTIGAPVTSDGLTGSTVVTNNGTFVALGFQNRTVDGKITGQVELHAFDPATGTLEASSSLLNDAQPDGGELFGRSLATLSFNGKDILVVAASNEIFSYYRTTLYPDAR